MDLKLYGNDYINSTLKNFVQEENINDLCKVTNNYANVAVYNHFYDENDILDFQWKLLYTILNYK
ncbi:MAG: hypothetical protein E6356_07860 [Terrisporobacter othiniensis]|uniref:Uncharacterized protein n=1 Tax=Terrisporobacter hibernicus TaxID=2813371 RepID=A0AAX2ZHR6_9FIRM|nr:MULTISPECIES: hypothetical protein [Terrisporobacter]MDU4861120.1 hypothetical protein [Terrisporobacter othiniensis]MDU6994754.1 hypothetical protein [Terrisporobacter othiniensis]UEL47907.1 hypothetical protein JW646_00195 [Terrisporobacter hibernicus]